jgi:hypothetical protein
MFKTWIPSTVGTVAIALLGVVTSGGEQGGERAIVRSSSDADLPWGPCPEVFPSGCEIAVLHGNPAQPNADVFLKVPGGYHIPLHSHTSAERMILLTGELRVTYDGQPPLKISPRGYAYGPAKLPHEATCSPGGQCILFIAFEQPVDAIAGGDER